MEQSRAFIAIISKHAADGFEARFPDLPYCIAFAATEDEAIVTAADALVEQLDELLQNAEPIPSPSTFAEIFADPQWRGCLATRVQPAARTAGRAADHLACDSAATGDYGALAV